MKPNTQVPKRRKNAGKVANFKRGKRFKPDVSDVIDHILTKVSQTEKKYHCKITFNIEDIVLK